MSPEIDTTAVDQFREYPPVHGVLVCDTQGFTHTNVVGVTANCSPKAHRGQPDLTCITVTINGLGFIAMSLGQTDEFIAGLLAARANASYARALSVDTP